MIMSEVVYRMFMDSNTLNRIMAGISVFWLIIIILRMVIYSSILSYSESGRLFAAILNVLLIGGIVLTGYILVCRLYPVLAVKMGADSRCPYCYSKVDSGADFCSACGGILKNEEEKE